MSSIQTVLSPVFAKDSLRCARRFLQSSLQFCAWSGARLRVITEKKGSETDTLIRELRSTLCCESVEFSVREVEAGSMVRAISEEAGEADLLALNLEKGLTGRTCMSREKATVFTENTTPILIVPGSLASQYPPVSSIMVAMAGERRQSEALRLALALGNDAGVPVDLLHVTASEKKGGNSSPLGEIADEFQHEYPGMVDEFIAEASPFSTEKEKLCIRHFWHMRGDASDLIRERMGEERSTGTRMLVLEWKGSLRSGRSAVLRSVLRHAEFPILVVRPDVQARARLRIGKDFPLAG